MTGLDSDDVALLVASAPNNRLFAYRRSVRGWSQAELAKRLAMSIREDGGTVGSMDELVRTISRWERGRSRPSPNFQMHLVLVFGVSAAELGLLAPDELARLPADLAPSYLRGAVPCHLTVDEMEPMVPPASGDSAALARRDRQIRSIQSILSSISRSSGSTLSLDPRDVETAQNDNRAHLRWYWRLPAQELLDHLLSRLELNVRILKPAQANSSNFRALANALAHDALIAARLLFFDLGQEARAERCFAIAAAAVEHASDSTLALTVYAHRAFVPGFAGDRTGADGWLERAEGCLLRARPSPLLEAWLRCVAAELYGMTGRTEQSIRSIERAHDALGMDGENPEWLDWFDYDRFDGFAGNAYLQAGRFELAASHLQNALTALGANAAKQRSVLLFDRALCEAPTDAEKAAASVREGCAAFVVAPYAAAVTTRIPKLTAALEGTPFASELSEQIRALPAVAV
ncbi:multiprotein-bridging factor 1 family protein [Lentzea sp. NPDC102401]|uniref:helix-turn-helix domain-containing protein n=1 Tax=Lentzea sp. NPDC102401 TaxID=3364128 RepID=UPI00380210ED